MPPTVSLRPQWKPLPLPPGATPYGEDGFAPCIVEEHGVVIAGGPNALHVLRLFPRQRRWFSIAARVTIHGFAVNDGTLYVQDGAVLSSWDLSTAGQRSGQGEGQRLAGVNLATSVRWACDRATLSDGQPAALYETPPLLAEAQAELRERSRQNAWHRLRADTQRLPAATAQSLLNSIDRAVGGPAPDTANARARAAIYSAPVVRRHQLGDAPGGIVFVLAGDGMFHALDGDLKQISRLKFAAPARAELTLIERPLDGDPSHFSCHLCYALADGGIRRVDAAVTPPTATDGWPGPRLARPAPSGAIRLHGNLLWAQGVLGPGLTAVALEPSPEVVFSAPNETPPWSDWDVAPLLGLAVLSSPTHSRLLACSPGASTRERWGGAVTHSPAWMRFLPDSHLVLQLERDAAAPDGDTAVVLRTANPIGAPNPAPCAPYPPPSIVHAAGNLEPGAFRSRLPRIASLRSAPVIERSRLFCTAAAETSAQQLAAWVSPRANGRSACDDFLAAQPDPSKAFPPAELAPEFLLGFSLAPLLERFEPAAAAEIARNHDVVLGSRVPLLRAEPPLRIMPD